MFCSRPPPTPPSPPSAHDGDQCRHQHSAVAGRSTTATIAAESLGDPHPKAQRTTPRQPTTLATEDLSGETTGFLRETRNNVMKGN